MCINYRIHHEHNMALQSAAGRPLNPNFAANADELQAQQYGDFTDCVLALPRQNRFCQSQHERRHRTRMSCPQKEPANKADFLTVHGLWPITQSIAARGVDCETLAALCCADAANPESA